MTLRDHAVVIWKAGVAAVDSALLVQQAVSCDRDQLRVGSEVVGPNLPRHIEVVGAGKAGAGMARGLEAALQELPPEVTLSGWVNVPDDCVQPLSQITLHPARPAGINEPTAAAVAGTEQILKRLQALSRDDLCLVLLSGGGSALLPAPVSGISLGDKLIVTRLLAAAGAPIQDLNCVRSQLSRVKGGGLLRHCRAGRLIALIISDVIGDPLEVIASGPTVPAGGSPEAALQVLRQYDPDLQQVPPAVVHWLTEAGDRGRGADMEICPVSNQIIGNNQTALQAAARQAAELGYRVMELGSANAGDANVLGRDLGQRLRQLKEEGSRQPICLLAGGETTVQLASTSQPRAGGRNQQLVLAAVAAACRPEDWSGMLLLSGGTDGEDGPTSAAGALADAQLVQQMIQTGLDPLSYLQINNSYPFFQQLDGLLQTGPTHTNVMDLQVGLLNPE